MSPKKPPSEVEGHYQGNRRRAANRKWTSFGGPGESARNRGPTGAEIPALETSPAVAAGAKARNFRPIIRD